MKLVSFRKTGRLGAKLLSLFLSPGLTLLSLAAIGQTSSTYTNLGNIIWVGSGNSLNTVPFPPQINATNFVNKGFMELAVAPSPFMTAHTLNFTNTGEMVGGVGYEFDYGPLPSGGRGMAANFFNGNFNPNTGAGVIESVSLGLPNPFSIPTDVFSYLQGFLWISATNIVNKGALLADAGCEIKLAGTNVNLSRSYLQIGGIPSSGSANGQSNFVADTAIYDQEWAQTNRPNLQSEAVWNGTTATLPPFVPFIVAEPCPVSPPPTELLSFTPNPAATACTNYTTGTLILMVTNSDDPNDIVSVAVATNITHMAAFVYYTDPNIASAIGFVPSANPSNIYQTVTVELQSAADGSTLFIQDTLASDAGRGLLANIAISPAAQCSGATFRPTNYIVERVDNNGIGSPGVFPVPPNFLYDNVGFIDISNLSTYSMWTNKAVSADYAVYSCFVDDQAQEPPSNPGQPNGNSAVTNLPGRVRIFAGNLDLGQTQIRGQGEVVVQANHLVSSLNALVDCENLSYNLGSTNGHLNVLDLAPQVAVRFRGTTIMTSAVWSNSAFVVTENYNWALDGSQMPPVLTNGPAFLTNTVQIGVYALLVDASRMSTTVPVTVYDLALHSTNMVISDFVSVVESFLLDGLSFTLDGGLAFPGISPINPVSKTPFIFVPIQNWVNNMAPSLLYFTNNGTLSIANDAHFGDDRPTNYQAFVNNAIITAAAQSISSADVEVNNGLNQASVGDFSVTANTATFSNAQITANGDIDIVANTLLIDPSLLSAGGTLNFTVATNLTDGGINAGNALSCQNGFNLWMKPQTGDLWGTLITSTASLDAEVDTVWAGEDRGDTNGAGFTNNVALGGLVLSPQEFTAPFYPLFFFTGISAHNGLYVGTLDLSQMAGNITNMLQLDPSLTIYYAHAQIDTTAIILGTNTTPEIYLDGRQFPPGSGGYLRFVKTMTPFAAAAAPAAPASGKLSASYAKTSQQVQFTLSGASGQTYIFQASTNMINWVSICTNITPQNGQVQFVDPKATNYPARFYRTVLGP